MTTSKDRCWTLSRPWPYQLTLMTFVAVLSFLSTSPIWANAACHEYIIKVSPQLSLCTSNQKTCLEAPFHHALDPKNYGGKYQMCGYAFDAEVNHRLLTSSPPTPDLQVAATAYDSPATAVEATLPNNMASSQIDPSAAISKSCQDAFYFFTYATKSCSEPSCVDQQFANTVKIVSFKHCQNPLTAARDARKMALPTVMYPAFHALYGH